MQRLQSWAERRLTLLTAVPLSDSFSGRELSAKTGDGVLLEAGFITGNRVFQGIRGKGFTYVEYPKYRRAGAIRFGKRSVSTPKPPRRSRSQRSWINLPLGLRACGSAPGKVSVSRRLLAALRLLCAKARNDLWGVWWPLTEMSEWWEAAAKRPPRPYQSRAGRRLPEAQQGKRQGQVHEVLK